MVSRPAISTRHLVTAWCLLAAGTAVEAPLRGQELQNGDVFAALLEGNIAQLTQRGQASRLLNTRSRGELTGMCFDASGNLYATNFTSRSMSKFDRNGRLVDSTWGGPFGGKPESCVVDAAGNIYTGEVGGENRIRKFTATGRLVGQYRPRTGERGIDWIDLAADQCTMFYTSEGSRVMRYDVCRDRQLSNFAQGLSEPCFALRVRENGEVLVACSEQVYRLKADGSVRKTYPHPGGDKLFAMNLDPDGAHFWTGPVSGNVYKVHIESGRGLSRPIFDASAPGSSDRSLARRLRGILSGDNPLGGLAVYGERTAALAETLRRNEEKENRAKARRKAEEERRRQEAARRAEEERQRQEALRRAEEQRQEALRRAEEERQRLEAERRAEEERLRREEEERQRREEEERRRREEEARRGIVDFGPERAVDFGPLDPGSARESSLDLTGTQVEEGGVVRVTTDFETPGVVLEIRVGDDWQRLGPEPTSLEIEQAGARRWPLRLRAGRCPTAVPAGDSHTIRLEAKGAEQTTARLQVPVALVIRESTWLQCWWPLLASLLGVALGGVVVHGFVSPARFPQRLGVQLSPEEDIHEGFFYPIRARRGFYRDARVYVTHDHRLRRKAAGALVRLRADGQVVRIKPASGATVWRQTADGEWQHLPAGESPARLGHLFRDDLETIFFELRNG